MLISNSVALPAGLHADAPNHPGPLASQILSGASRTQQPSVAQGQSGAASQANPEARQSDAPRVHPQNPLAGWSSRSAPRREARKTNQPADAAANGSQLAATNQSAEPAQFLEILGDILPKGSLPQDQTASGHVLSQFSGTTPNPSYPVATSTVPKPFGPVTSEANTAAAQTVATNTSLAGGSQPVNDGASNATSSAQAPGPCDALLDSALKGSEAAAGAQKNAGEPVEVAFAARIAARPDLQVIAPNEAQAAIAASRFARLDGTKTQSHAEPAAGDQTASAAPALGEEPVAVAASGFEGAASDGSSGEPQSDAEPNTRAGASSTSVPPTGVGQSLLPAQTLTPDALAAAQPQAGATAVPPPAAGRAPSAQATWGPMGPRTAGTGPQGSNSVGGSPNASFGFAMAAPASAGVAGGRSATNAKPAQDDRAPQFSEAQNEPAESAGEVVRAISLNLSSKDQSVQVRLSERAGELHVTVRTPDAGLTHGLREGLSDLVGRLEHGGYRAEAWQPGGSASNDRGQDSPSRRGSSQQQNSGGKGSGQQDNSQDSESDAQTPKWMGELETSLQRSNSVWPPSATR